MMPEKPIFMEPWWMDAVCAGKQWQYVLPEMPCLISKRGWMKWICMPQMTQMGGMWIDVTKCTIAQAHDKAVEIDKTLRSMKLAYYYQQYPVGNPLPAEMRQLGYKVRERITYRIDDLSDLDKVIDRFSKNKKRQMQKALSLHAEHEMSVEDFYQFHCLCMSERKRQLSYSREFLLVLDRKLRRQKQGEILSICDADGKVLAAAYLVWDKQYLYYLIPCFLSSRKDSGASALLVLEAIKLARTKGLKFDFEGSSKRSIANDYKQYGGEPTVYYSVEKRFKWLFSIALFFNWIRNLKYGI